jgi:hypothetical protein
MSLNPIMPEPRRRIWPRYVFALALLLALGAGWTWAWNYSSGLAQAAVEGWRAREAKAGRVYACGSQRTSGYPFRIEVSCDTASAVFRSNQPPVEIKAGGILIAAQVYEPTQLVSDIEGPVTIAKIGQAPIVVANWKLGRSSVSGTPKAPQAVSLLFDEPVVNFVDGGRQQTLLRAKRIEVHGRIAEGSAAHNPVIEIVLRLVHASAPGFNRAAVQPVDARITAVLRGLGDFSPKPWHERFRELQAKGGRIDITKARLRQGGTLAVGSGSLSIDRNGELDGAIDVTVAGLAPFLVAIGAQQAVQKSHGMDKIAGMLDRLSPGLGDVARQQAGANLSLGLTMLGKPASLEGRQAVTLPLRFKDGTAYLGPIPLGSTPALF